MKISYDKKTNFMALRFESGIETYVEDFKEGIDIVLAEEDDRVVGYNLYEADKTILDFEEVRTSQKLAMLVKLYRKMLDLTQEEVSEKTLIPLPTLKMIEKGDKETSVENVSRLKKVLSEMDLNALSKSKVA